MVRLIPVLLAALAPAGQARAASPAGKPADVYIQDRVWTIHLSIGAKEWQTMQPTRGGFPGAEMRAGKQSNPLTAERRLRGGFQYDFEYVKGDITIDGTLFKDVAIRLKGSGSYALAMQSAKKSFRVDLDRYTEGLSFKGIKNLTLNNNALDPTMHREALSYAVYRAAGVPAPRTAYAQVTISVPGKYDREFLGLYSLVETVDKPFLKEHFGSSKGLLVKPERVGPLEYLGEDWKPYQEKYRPKGEASKKQQKRLIDFVRLVQKADAATFRQKIESHLDVDRFLRFLASTVLLASMDSFIGLNHNWMMYLDPGTDKFVFMPWDLDLSFGGFQMLGSKQDLEDLSIRQPFPAQNRLIERVLAEEQYYAAYKGHLQRLLKSGFAHDAVKKDLAAIKKATDPIRKREDKAAAARRERRDPGVAWILGHSDIEGFVAKRIDSVRAQLDGKSKGTTPRSAFAPGGGNPAAALVRPVLHRADGDRDGNLDRREAVAAVEGLFTLVDLHKKGEVEEAALARSIDRILPKPMAFGGFRAQSQAPGIAKKLLERAGKDGKVTKEGLVILAGILFVKGDRNKDGKLDATELGEALREVVAAPPPGGRFNPALPLARPALVAADTDKDGKLTKAEVIAAAKALFKACASDQKGEVDQATLTTGLGKIVPEPQAFGGFTPPSQAPALARVLLEKAGKFGKLTEAGLLAYAEKAFAAADKDGLGKVDEEDLVAALDELLPVTGFGGPGGFNPAIQLVRPALEAADKDIDGMLTRAEAIAGIEALFKACQADNGAVSQKQLEQALGKLLPKPQAFGAFTPASMAPGLASSLIKKAGKDGKVTKASLIALAEKLFEKADRGKDGKLTEAELAEALREVAPPPRLGAGEP